MFPEEIPKRLIKMFSFVRDTVLDPFLGSGTTSLAAKNLDRNSVGYEINPEFTPYIKQKLNVEQYEIFGAKYEFIGQSEIDIDFNKEINKLPYVFKDFHALDKKVDPRELQFGSKIDKNGSSREDYYSVKEIVSPEIIKLSNGLTVRLLGIKEDASVNGEAIEFLKLKTKKQKVYIRLDNEKYDEDNNLLCYLYLKNKTFINAHLIKKGFVLVDSQREYKYKKKFLKLKSS